MWDADDASAGLGSDFASASPLLCCRDEARDGGCGLETLRFTLLTPFPRQAHVRTSRCLCIKSYIVRHSVA